MKIRAFNHIVADRAAPSTADIYFTWRNQLNEKGKSGYQYLHSVRPTNALNFKDYFIKKKMIPRHILTTAAMFPRS